MLLITMSSVKSVGLCILTNIGSPTEICFIDCLDKKIHLVWWFVFQVEILSLLLSSFYLYIFLFFWSFSCYMFSLDGMMACDFIIFDFTGIICFSFFNVIVFSLKTVEALYIMLLHCALLACFTWDRLDKTDHCFITFGVKLFVISWLYLTELTYTSCLSIRVRVLAYVGFYIISKIGNESHTIIEFNVECLVINWRPFSWDHLSLTLLSLWT